MTSIPDRKAQLRKTQREKRLLERQMNPCPGRSTAECQYIKRLLTEIHKQTLRALEASDFKPNRFLPMGVISTEANRTASAKREAWVNIKRDNDGYLIGAHDHQQKSTNSITVGTWYRNADQNLYAVFQTIPSPLPCDEWGSVPLTLSHWRVIAQSMTAAHALWKWVFAVQDYWQDKTWEYGGSFGWTRNPCVKLLEPKGKTLCTGQAIYLHQLEKYSRHLEKIAGDI